MSNVFIQNRRQSQGGRLSADKLCMICIGIWRTTSKSEWQSINYISTISCGLPP
jgi:hypothetical protein